MKIKLNLNKSLHENIADYHEQIKDVRKKIEGVEAAINDTKKEMEKEQQNEEKKKSRIRTAKEKKWFEKFHWFYTSEGKMAIGGKDAKQNDFVFGKHMEENDLFFHADIQGGTAVILKDGANATETEKREVAQFAASFSNAWKNGNAAVDVYCVKKSQLSKHSNKGFIPVGGFEILGEREWFRSTKLGLKAGIGENGLEILPDIAKKELKNSIILFPAVTGKEKGQIAKSIAKRLGVHPDELLQILPSGKMKTKL
ncbi:MAG: NFACT RNA binding domain-containing protein [Candidatus Micrarchaeia archaeon]